MCLTDPLNEKIQTMCCIYFNNSDTSYLELLKEKVCRQKSHLTYVPKIFVKRIQLSDMFDDISGHILKLEYFNEKKLKVIEL